MTSYSTTIFGKEGQEDGQLLLVSCQVLAAQSEPASSNPCVFYIQGLLAGIRTTNIVSDTSHSEVNEQWTSFIERAYRTRVGSQAKSRQPTPLNLICLPDDESLTQVIDVLSNSLSLPAETIDILKVRVVQVLRAEYPCG